MKTPKNAENNQYLYPSLWVTTTDLRSAIKVTTLEQSAQMFQVNQT